ncbi:MAG: hypothetical protein DMG49_01595 [Acidobacteria bacterium]|nr:MAG: hypothetical protein DMG49_01595 [Acidobacteriota bacterium]
MMGSTAEETSSAVGIILPKALRCRCRCTTTIRRLPTILFSETIKTYSTSISNTGFTLGIHNNLYGDLATARSVIRTTPVLRFLYSLIKSLSTSSAHSFRMKSAWLTIGCKSHSVPNLWNLTPNQSIWTAVSRAVRTPALTEEGLRLNSAVIPPGTLSNPAPFPAVVAVFGSPQFNSEDLLAYELGYRVQATSNLSLDIATFYNNYSNLRTAEPGTPFPEGSPAPTDIVIPFVAGNKMSGGTYGVELFADWKVVPKWRLVGSYSYLQMDIHKNANSQDPTPDNPNGSSPRHQWYLRSSVDLPKHFEQDTTLRFVDRLPSLNLPNYYSLDAHLGWRPVTKLELSVGGQNVLNNWHLEFMPDFVNTSPTVVKRSIFGSITVKF